MKINKITKPEIKNLISKIYENHLTEKNILLFLAELSQNHNNLNGKNQDAETTTQKTQKNKTTLSDEVYNSYDFVKSTKNVKELIHNVTKYIHQQTLEDVSFINSSDPAVSEKSATKTAPSNGLIATVYYRISSYFYYMGVATNRRNLKTESIKLSQFALSQTGVDIHPAAKISAPLFIDHGYGLVIGGTAEVGKNCMLFNGVVLGSRSVKKPNKSKRHPTLQNGVIVCAGAKILGNIVLGNNVFVSPNAVVIDNIDADHEVLIVNQLQIKKQNKNTYLPSQQLIVYGVVPKFKNSIHILGEGFYNPKVLIQLKNKKELNYHITYWDKNKIIIKFKHSVALDKEVSKGAKIIVFSNSHKVIVVSSAGLEKSLTTFSS